MKIAIVHDFLNQFGGAERVVSALHELYPEAPIYTSIYDANRMPAEFSRMDVHPSFMQNLPFIFSIYKWYFYFYPLAFESFDLSGYDLILSSSSAYAKGIKKHPGQLHICYCHTPMRFVWRYEDYVRRESIPAVIKDILPFLLEPLKKWDLQTARGVDQFIANSVNVAGRIAQTYQRESVIINPPVEVGLFQPSAVDRDYFLVVSRLNAYKRIDTVVKAFKQLDMPLKIVGDGPMRKNLEKIAGPNTEFLGKLSDHALARRLAECRALVFPGEEDFGIAPLEAMASGRPVIAYKAGGAVETVVEGETGLFFTEQTPGALAEAVKRSRFIAFDKKKIQAHAKKYDKEIFKAKIKGLIEEKMRDRRK